MNALSIPTWVIHISSVIEWITAIFLVQRFAKVRNLPAWRSMSWAMLPSLVSAMCACTWHFFDNAPRLNWLVTTQAATTLIGNCTMMASAWWIWKQRSVSPAIPSPPAPNSGGADLN